VTIGDEATGPNDGLTCTVVAHNASGSSAPARSQAVLVAMNGTLGCARASGSLTRTAVGPLKLGMTRMRARRRLKRFTITQNGFDNFCLYAGWGIRAAYPTAKLMRSLSPTRRRALTGRIVLALTANPFYALSGVHPGASAASAVRRLKMGRPIRVGLNLWYVKPARMSTEVLKVQHGVLQELGLADRSLTAGHAAQVRFLNGFPRI
jgi:hypothetical protein